MKSIKLNKTKSVISAFVTKIINIQLNFKKIKNTLEYRRRKTNNDMILLTDNNCVVHYINDVPRNSCRHSQSGTKKPNGKKCK